MKWRNVKGGLGGGWEALCQFSFMKRDSPIRRMGSGEWLQSIPTPVVSDPGVTIVVVVVVVVEAYYFL